MKPPLSYYGGKQRLAKTIISMIPEHRVYCEPFAGGAAVFFNKPPSKVEIINDTNGELIYIYRVVKHKFRALQKEIEVSLHSRMLWEQAGVIYRNPEKHSGHYGGYIQEHFDELLDLLSKIKGKFLLSSYPNEGLENMRGKHNWHQVKIVQALAMSNKAGQSPRKKTEVLTANYKISLTENNYEMTKCPSLEF